MNNKLNISEPDIYYADTSDFVFLHIIRLQIQENKCTHETESSV